MLFYFMYVTVQRIFLREEQLGLKHNNIENYENEKRDRRRFFISFALFALKRHHRKDRSTEEKPCDTFGICKGGVGES